MTARKHLKARIRARMAQTGERYVTAHRHVVGEADPLAVDHGYRLRGGVHPDTAAVANVLAHHGVVAGHTGEPLSEAMVLGIGGGLGAGYILWEFESRGGAILVLGFRNRWQYPDRWMKAVLERLAVPAAHLETGGARTAARQLDEALAAGRPALATIDCQSIGYWHLPAELEGRGGYPVVVYAIDDDVAHVDDRGLAPRTVERSVLDAARGRVGSYRNRLCVIEPDRDELPVALLRDAVRAGLADAAEHLGLTVGLVRPGGLAQVGADDDRAAGEGVAARVRLRSRAGGRAALDLRGHPAGRARRRPPARPLRRLPRRGGGAARGARARRRRGRLARRRGALAGAGGRGAARSGACASCWPRSTARSSRAATRRTPAAELWDLRRSLDEAAPVDTGELFPAMGALLEEIYEAEAAASGAKNGVET